MQYVCREGKLSHARCNCVPIHTYPPTPTHIHTPKPNPTHRLPNGLSGIVPITEVCEDITKLAEREAEKANADSDSEEEEEEEESEVPSMTDLFKVCVCVCVSARARACV